ncbi:hypothetical protein PCCS19_05490 [Paenibacillus sp. CCS19]|uniref:AraC family transcriptional regulator n=1 Tax=Paenibacillus sp. CCS19 TaxID=3158387 RepID=UPI00255ED1E2|nr:helix-turn-helix domain-containing protein [Paenibacillus cellulosilyticus]GMK37495.1 hypothetical protein PCCS19_05490 [Paenibacillus cellulosilyticus]
MARHTIRGADLFRSGLNVFVNRIEENFVDSDLHEHDFIELNYVAEGLGFQYLGDKALPASRGDFFALPIGSSHVFRPYSTDKKNRLVVYNVVFTPAVLEQISAAAPELALGRIWQSLAEQSIEGGIVRDTRSALAPLFERIYAEHAADRPGASAMLTALLTQILIEWTRLRSTAKEPNASTLASMDEAIAYVRERALDRLTQEDAASRFGLSERHFQRLFQRHTGQTFLDFVQHQRIMTACELLRSTQHKLEAIAGLVGYRDIQSFNRVFKRIEGTTPGQYRRTFFKQ